MTLFLICALIIVGLTLVIVEVMFVPGITFVGLIGVILMISGVFLTYSNYERNIGHIVLGLSSFVTIAALIYGFKTGAWNKLSNKDAIDSKVNEIEDIKEGDTGLAVSDLRPAGKGIFHEKKYEVHTMGEYVIKDTPLVVTKIAGYKIFVKAKIADTISTQDNTKI